MIMPGRITLLAPLPASLDPGMLRGDFRQSRRLEKYRYSRLALYIPAGFSWKALPWESVEAFSRITRLVSSDNGVCPFSMEMPGIRLCRGGEQWIVELEKDKNADALLALLKEVCPRPA